MFAYNVQYNKLGFFCVGKPPWGLKGLHSILEGIGYCPGSLLTQTEGHVSIIEEILFKQQDLISKL